MPVVFRSYSKIFTVLGNLEFSVSRLKPCLRIKSYTLIPDLVLRITYLYIIVIFINISNCYFCLPCMPSGVLGLPKIFILEDGC